MEAFSHNGKLFMRVALIYHVILMLARGHNTKYAQLPFKPIRVPDIGPYAL